MPDLGQYAVEVLLAYGVSLGLIGALVVWVWRRAVRTRRALRALEARVRTARKKPAG